MRLCTIALALVWGASAWAQDEDPRGNYLNLSFAGDGETPTALERFTQSQPSARGSQASANVGEQGDATYGFTVPLPPARVKPSLSLSYSSGGGMGWVGRGKTGSADFTWTGGRLGTIAYGGTTPESHHIEVSLSYAEGPDQPSAASKLCRKSVAVPSSRISSNTTGTPVYKSAGPRPEPSDASATENAIGPTGDLGGNPYKSGGNVMPVSPGV